MKNDRHIFPSFFVSFSFFVFMGDQTCSFMFQSMRERGKSGGRGSRDVAGGGGVQNQMSTHSPRVSRICRLACYALNHLRTRFENTHVSRDEQSFPSSHEKTVVGRSLQLDTRDGCCSENSWNSLQSETLYDTETFFFFFQKACSTIT